MLYVVKVVHTIDGTGFLYRGRLVQQLVNATPFTSPSAARRAIERFQEINEECTAAIVPLRKKQERKPDARAL